MLKKPYIVGGLLIVSFLACTEPADFDTSSNDPQTESQFDTMALMAGGACTVADKHSYINNNTEHGHEFARKWISCGKENLGKSAPSTKCIRDAYPGLNGSCVNCFGQYVGCSASKCFFQCAFSPDSAACVNCSITSCQPALERCAGIGPSEVPRAN